MRCISILLLLVLLFGWFIFFRFYQLQERYQFTWDQIENAWVMKTMIIDGKFPTKGMEAKATSGFSIGPGFYYLLYPFFLGFNLDPIAGGVFAGVVAVITFWLFYWGLKKIGGIYLAISTLVLYSFSFYAISFDRIAWPVALIPFVSLIIFYSWWQILSGKVSYYLLLGLGMGLMFHLHMTVIYMILIAICLIPFLPWKEKTHLRFLLGGIIIAIIFLLPMILSYGFTNVEQSRNVTTYLGEQFHGLHLRRVIQVFPDMLIEFSGILSWSHGKILYPVVFLVGVLLVWRTWGVKKVILIGLWFFIPLLIMSLYKGEITQYYFATTRVVVFFLLGVILSQLLTKHVVFKILALSFLVGFMLQNTNQFFNTGSTKYLELKEKAIQDVKNKKQYHFTMGDPYTYIHEWTVYSVYTQWSKENDWLTFPKPK